jgi:hypothetical protein
MHMKTRMTIAAALFSLAVPFALLACGGDDASTPDAHQINDIDGGVPDAKLPSNADAGCISDPKTSDEILNACTDPAVTVIPKHSTLPLIGADGKLPPLPNN